MSENGKIEHEQEAKQENSKHVIEGFIAKVGNRQFVNKTEYYQLLEQFLSLQETVKMLLVSLENQEKYITENKDETRDLITTTRVYCDNCFSILRQELEAKLNIENFIEKMPGKYWKRFVLRLFR